VASDITGPKRHHFVPRMLQKRFVDEDGYLYAHNRERPTFNIYRARPENLFVQSHLYSEIEVDGKRQPRTERRISNLENAADRIIEYIINSIHSGKLPTLSDKHLDIWYHFFVLQWRRVPDLSNSPENKAIGEEVFSEIIADARIQFPQFGSQIDQMGEPSNRARLIHNSRLASLGMSAIVLEALRTRGLAIAKIYNPRKKFILSSRPVIKLTEPGKAEITHPECQTWLPVAPDIALGLGRGPGTISLHAISEAEVRYLNLATARQSQTIASSSYALIRSIARPR
jgi:hypothetical protein